MNAGEQLMSDVAAYISELVPVNIEQVKGKLSKILTRFHVLKYMLSFRKKRNGSNIKNI